MLKIYHDSVISMLQERNLYKLLQKCVLRTIIMTQASGGLFCTVTRDGQLTVNISLHHSYKRNDSLAIPLLQYNTSFSYECRLYTLNDSVFGPEIQKSNLTTENVIISPLYIKKQHKGVLLVFDHKDSHTFTPSDCAIIASISETFSHIAGNLLDYRSNRKKAQTDSLTGLLNRRAFLNRADYEIRRSLRFNHPMAICMFDIDHFKQINDRWGHAAGDQVLLSLATLFTPLLREIDCIARYGGDEFIILLTETPPDVALEAAERFKSAVTSTTVSFRSININLSLSIGIASLCLECKTSKRLIERADAAMYQAKRTGRNRIVLWNRGIDDHL